MDTTKHTYDADLFSDFFKAANGVRPRGHEFYSATPDRKQELWDNLSIELEENEKEEAEMEARSLINFKKKIETLKAMGAETTIDALRWLIMSESGWEFHELGYLVYTWNLPSNHGLPIEEAMNKCHEVE